MGFRIGWWAKKWFGITWGSKGGFRLYGMFGGRGGGGILDLGNPRPCNCCGCSLLLN